MEDERTLQIGQFAELVGLSIPQLRRYDRLRLLNPAGRVETSGYRYYSQDQTGAARVIALLRSMDMPIAEVREIVAGADETERARIIREHRARLEARLDEVHRLLDAVDALTEKEEAMSAQTTELSAWLHLMPRLPVTDMERSITYYQEALGFRLAWRTIDTPEHRMWPLAALASGPIEMVLLMQWPMPDWHEVGSPLPAQDLYVFVEDPDALCAEYQAAGADVVEPVASGEDGMRAFSVRDPDGHRFTLGRGEERLRDIADRYGLTPDEISVNPASLPRHR